MLQLATLSHIQRIPRNDVTNELTTQNASISYESSEESSEEESLDLKLDELKRNLTTGLPPDAVAIIDNIVENMRNTSEDSLKDVAGVSSIIFYSK